MPDDLNSRELKLDLQLRREREEHVATQVRAALEGLGHKADEARSIVDAARDRIGTDVDGRPMLTFEDGTTKLVADGLRRFILELHQTDVTGMASDARLAAKRRSGLYRGVI